MAAIRRARRPIRARRTELAVASLRLRFAALLLDLVTGLSMLALAAGAGVLAHRLVRKRRGEVAVERRGPLREVLDEPVDQRAHPAARLDMQRIAETLRSRPVNLALELVGIILPVVRPEPRSPAHRLLGLRLVDARTGDRPSARQRLVSVLAQRVWRELTGRLLPNRTPPASPERDRLRDEVAAARCAHAQDQDALQRALMTIYRENERVPIGTFSLRPLARAALIAALGVPMPQSSRRQSFVEWLTGTVVVVDR